MSSWTAPTTQTSGALITASTWNTDLVENLKYLKDAPTLTGALTLTAGQIVFPASQNASAGANTLDDYEEGTYTPTWTTTGSAPSIGNGTLSGAYVKVGQLVTVTAKLLAGSSTTFGTGDWRLTVPFASGSVEACGIGFGDDSGSPTGYPTLAFLDASTSTMEIYRLDALWTAYTATVPFTWGTGDYLVVTITYRASA